MLTGKTSVVFRTNGGRVFKWKWFRSNWKWAFCEGEIWIACVSAAAQFKRETWFKTVIVVLGQAFGTRHYLRITLLEMAFRNAPCELSILTDIDQSEIFLSHRQRLIEEKLLKCYTDEVASEICKLVLLNCNGCRIAHPSQRQYDCLMMEAEEKMWV